MRIFIKKNTNKPFFDYVKNKSFFIILKGDIVSSKYIDGIDSFDNWGITKIRVEELILEGFYKEISENEMTEMLEI